LTGDKAPRKVKLVLRRWSADIEVETDSNQHDEEVAIDGIDEEELMVEEESGDLTKIIPVTTPTRIIGVTAELRVQQLAPVEGAEGLDIHTEDEKAWMERLNRYAWT
jgi:hypothetical protein